MAHGLTIFGSRNICLADGLAHVPRVSYMWETQEDRLSRKAPSFSSLPFKFTACPSTIFDKLNFLGVTNYLKAKYVSGKDIEFCQSLFKDSRLIDRIQFGNEWIIDLELTHLGHPIHYAELYRVGYMDGNSTYYFYPVNIRKSDQEDFISFAIHYISKLGFYGKEKGKRVRNKFQRSRITF